MIKKRTQNEKISRPVGLTLTLIAAALLFALVAFLVGKPMIQFVSEPHLFREWVDETGVFARFVFVGMMVIQIIIAIIPGEPLEIAAGYAFGAVEGTALCVIGALIGSMSVFLLVKRFGVRFVSLFFSANKLKEIKFLQNERKLTLVAFSLFLIPGTPKDMMTYFVGLTPMRTAQWFFITLFARFPSIVLSTIGGSALSEGDYSFAAAVFIGTLVASLLGILIYRLITQIRVASQAVEREETLKKSPVK